MSNITSPWISTANIGDWEYFIFTDSQSVVQVMNGLAAWFNGAGGGLVQGAALLGGLVLLMYALFGAATRSNKTSPLVIGTWALIVASVGITGRAVVTNVYTGQVSVVANVPAIALVPASVFSKAGYRIFQDIDQAYQTTSGSYMSVGQWGFVGPLDVLLALRSNKAPGLIGPEVYRSLKQVLTDCGTDPSNPPPAGVTLENSIDAMAYLVAYGRKTGLTMVYPTTSTVDGQIESCADAFVWLNNRFSALASSSALIKLNAASVLPNPQAGSGMWGANATAEAYDLLIAGALTSSQSAVQYTKNALVASYVTYSRDCFSSNNSIVNPTECANAALAVGEGLEQWKTGAAAGGQGFLKTMFTSMGFMQVMFFSFFPFVIVYAVATGMQSAKVVGGYIFFGIWTQSWVIVVAPIQSYIQNNVISIVKKTTDSQGITIGNANALYERLSTQLGVASDMMAGAQMMSLALISGSIYAMVGMANRWSGATSMNTNSVQRDLSQESGLIKENPLMKAQFIGAPAGGVSNQGMTAVATNEGASNLGFSNSRTATATATSSNEKQRSAVDNLTQSLSASMGSSMGSKISSEDVSRVAEKSNAAYKAYAGINTAMLGGLSKAGFFNGMSESAKAQSMASINAQASTAFAAYEEKNPGWFKQFVAGNEDAINKGADIITGIAAVGTVGAAAFGTGGLGTPAAATLSLAGRQAVKEGLKSWTGSISKEVKESMAGSLSRPGSTGAAQGAKTIGKGMLAAEVIGDIMGGVNKGLNAGADAVFGSDFSKEVAAVTSVGQDTQNKIAIDAMQAASRTNAFAESRSFSTSEGATLANQQSIVNDRIQLMDQFSANPQDMAAVRSQAASLLTEKGDSKMSQQAMRVAEDTMRGVQAFGGQAGLMQAMKDAIYLNEMNHRINFSSGGGSSANGVTGAAPSDSNPDANSTLSGKGMRNDGLAPGAVGQVGTSSLGNGFDAARDSLVKNEGDFAQSLTSTNASAENRAVSGDQFRAVEGGMGQIENAVKLGAGVSAATQLIGGAGEAAGDLNDQIRRDNAQNQKSSKSGPGRSR